MPTFNEQKGQGAFQPVLSEPGAPSPGGRTVPGPALSAAAAGISGAASIFDVLANRPLPPDVASEELVANKTNLESELVGELSLIADAPIPSGIFRQAKADVDRVASAFRQGRMSQTEINVRLASVVQRYISQDPRNAEKYRDLARNVLGVVPTEEILSERIADIQFEETQQREIARDEADFAISKGVVVPDGNGGINVEATAIQGRELRRLEAEQNTIRQRLELQKLLLETENGRKLTQTERDNMEYQQSLQTLVPLLDTRMNGLRNSIELFKQGPQATQMSREEQITQLSNSVNVLRAEVTSIINEVSLSNGLTPTTRNNLLKAYNDELDAVGAMFTGDLSEFENTQRMLKLMDANDGAAIRKAAPLINRYRLAFGEEFVGDLVREGVQSTPELKIELNRSAFQIAQDVLKPGVDVATGQRAITEMSQPERRSAVKVSMKAISNMVKRPQVLDEQQRQALKNTEVQMVSAALNTANVLDRARGVAQLSTDANLSAMELLRANDPEFEEIGAALRDANALAFTESARRAQPDTTANQVVSGLLDPITGADTRAKQFITVYNARTGRIEIHSGRDGKFKKATERLPPSLDRDVQRMNDNLDAVVRLKDFGRTDLSKFSDNQIRQGFVLSTGAIGIANEDALEDIPGGVAGFFGIDETPVGTELRE